MQRKQRKRIISVTLDKTETDDIALHHLEFFLPMSRPNSEDVLMEDLIRVRREHSHMPSPESLEANEDTRPMSCNLNSDCFYFACRVCHQTMSANRPNRPSKPAMIANGAPTHLSNRLPPIFPTIKIPSPSSRSSAPPWPKNFQ